MEKQEGQLGARVYLMNEPNETTSKLVILVTQTRKRGVRQNSPYVIDSPRRDRFIDYDDDEKLATAIRDALNGQL